MQITDSSSENLTDSDLESSKFWYKSSKVQYFAVKNFHYDTFFPNLKHSSAKIVNSCFSLCMWNIDRYIYIYIYIYIYTNIHTHIHLLGELIRACVCKFRSRRKLKRDESARRIETAASSEEEDSCILVSWDFVSVLIRRWIRWHGPTSRRLGSHRASPLLGTHSWTLIDQCNCRWASRDASADAR